MSDVSQAPARQVRVPPPARRRRILPLVVFLTAAALFVTGVNLGEAASVFEKAVTVCLSCIGIG